MPRERSNWTECKGEGCGKRIAFALREDDDKFIPLDPEVPEGQDRNLYDVTERDDGKLVAVRVEPDADVEGELMVSHFVTCPAADSFSGRGKKGKPEPKPASRPAPKPAAPPAEKQGKLPLAGRPAAPPAAAPESPGRILLGAVRLALDFHGLPTPAFVAKYGAGMSTRELADRLRDALRRAGFPEQEGGARA